MIDRNQFMRMTRPFIGTDVIKVITGLRRCGKSIFLEQIKNEIKKLHGDDPTIVSFNLEDDENEKFLKEGVLYDHVNQILTENPKKKVYIFLDEIHDVEGWKGASTHSGSERTQVSDETKDRIWGF